MNALVTGAAGFVGSHLCEELLDHGYSVRGSTASPTTTTQGTEVTERRAPVGTEGFRFTECDLYDVELGELLEDVDVVFHLAGQPGVRPSWGKDFDHYVRQNILDHPAAPRSGQGTTGPQARLRVQLVGVRRRRVLSDAPSRSGPRRSRLTVSRSWRPSTSASCTASTSAYRRCLSALFTVYGPRQRPDMAFSRLVDAAVSTIAFELYGDGSQTRDFTFVADVVSAMRGAALGDAGSRTSAAVPGRR